ncbi:ABC transporter substrate-binding protein [Amycolatopsis jiangsuensis]|uniref:Peptide/nickel transport system substrate-binding protein n=1 Tax=Amycolatopsis jiangsuensis TaxID=1181879 RepID=A0A840IY28_9PSEU|nr:ABC transporter substrate-binding protein [Amycolatopsis jiangsuensis]MBB4685774.1 peptide/nickel transport system substrate-binding protein [Amycolatopsis jiangsuensis]
MKKTIAALAGAGVLTAALTACGGGGQGGSVVEGGTFTYLIGSDLGTLDPQFTTLSVAIQAGKFLYDSLVSLDPKGEETAALAQQWEGDTTHAKYTLRKGVTCSDGSPLTAKQVADNINFVTDPANGSSMLGLTVQPGVRATADEAAGTVTVTAAAPDAFLVRNVGSLPIVCAKGMRDRGLLKQGSDGTGMFTLTEAVSGDHYTFTRRKDYRWGPNTGDPRGMPEHVVLRVVGNETTTANLLVSDQANAAQVNGPERQRLDAMDLEKKATQAILGEMWFDQAPGLPTADEAVRRALTQALDLGQLGQVLTSGTGRPTDGLVAPGMGPCGSSGLAGLLPKSDATAAKSALDSAGWVAGAGGVRAKDGKKLSVSFYYPTTLGSTMQAAAELVQQRWSAIGVQVEVKGMTDAESSQILAQNSWGAALVPLTTVLPSQLVPFFSGPGGTSGNNFAQVHNPEYDAAVKAASSLTGTSGCGKWADAEKALVRALNVVPFVNSVRPTYVQGARFDLAEGSIIPGSIRMLG